MSLIGSWRGMLTHGLKHGLLTGDQLRELATSPTPIHPLRFAVRGSANASFITALSNQLQRVSSKDWPKVQQLARTLSDATDVQDKVRNIGREKTVNILNPRETFNVQRDWGFLASGDHQFHSLDTPDGRHLLIFTQIETLHIVENGELKSFQIPHNFIDKRDITLISPEEFVIAGAVGNGRSGMAVIGFNFKKMEVTKTYLENDFEAVNGNSDLGPMWVNFASAPPEILTLHGGTFAPFSTTPILGKGVRGNYWSKFRRSNGDTYVVMGYERTHWHVGLSSQDKFTWLPTSSNSTFAPDFLETDKGLLLFSSSDKTLNVHAISDLNKPLRSIPLPDKSRCPAHAILHENRLLVAVCAKDGGLLIFEPFAEHPDRSIAVLPQAGYSKNFAWATHEHRLLLAARGDEGVSIYEPLVDASVRGGYKLKSWVYEETLEFKTSPEGELHLRFMSGDKKLLHVLKVFNPVDTNTNNIN